MEEPYNKVLNELDYYDGVVSYPEPDILEWEVQWIIRSTAVNKASGWDEIPAELFRSLKEDTIKVLHSLCQQIWKIQQWPQNWKRSILIPVSKKGNTKNTLTIIQSHSSPRQVRSHLKSCTLGFSIMRTKNFQMSKLALEEKEELEIKLPTFAGL